MQQVIILSSILFSLYQIPAAQTFSDTKKHFEYHDTTFATGKLKILEVYFRFDTSALRPESSPALDSLINFLKSYPYIGIEIGNHTDQHCKTEFCLTLSQARAESVCEYLILNGISGDRLICKGYGKSKPVYGPYCYIEFDLRPVRRTEVTIISNSEY